MCSAPLLPALIASHGIHSAIPLRDDLIYGPEAIAKELGLDKAMPIGKAIRRVYKMRERGKAPIFYLDGVGLVARKSALAAYLLQRELDAEVGQR